MQQIGEYKYNAFRLKVYELPSGKVKGVLTYNGCNGELSTIFEKGTSIERVREFFSIKFC